MATTVDIRPPAQPSLARQISGYFWRKPWFAFLLLLLPPMLWLVVFYLGSLASMLLQSFYTVDENAVLVKQLSLSTYHDLLQGTNIDIIVRTATMAALVTITCALIGFPLAYFMARYASNRVRSLLYLAVLMPLWSSYLVRVYSWKLILANEGLINWILQLVGLTGFRDWLLGIPVIGGPSLSLSYIGMFFVFVYIWLPYMILPVHSALERVPRSLIEASSDLGARPGYTFRRIILPLAFPGVVAGSIFTFSLTLGDYIIPRVIGQSVPFIGPTVDTLHGTTGNIPLAAAFTIVPIVIMGIYLLIAQRLGAFDAL